MKVVCISKEVTGGGLTFGKKYDVIERGSNPKYRVYFPSNFYVDSFLLTNDNGIEMWYDRSSMLIEIVILTGNSIKYIGNPSNGLTIGKCYELLDREIDYGYFNFIDDYDQFVGISKINYFGVPNFIEITKVRNDKIEQILK